MRRVACGIDLGTANTLICSADGEIVVNEPSAVTVHRDGTIESVGIEAHRALGRNPGFLQPEHPVRSGVVTDLDHAQTLLRRFIERLQIGRSQGGCTQLLLFHAARRRWNDSRSWNAHGARVCRGLCWSTRCLRPRTAAASA